MPDPDPRRPPGPAPGADPGPAPGADPAADPARVPARGWLERRREKIRAEVERNRRGEYTVPTWVLASILVAFVAAWAALIIFA